MNTPIKGYALAILLFMIVRGIIFFQLPSLVTKEFGTNSWIMLYVFTALVIAHLYLIYKGSKKHQNASIWTIIHTHFPKPVAAVLIIAPSLLFIVISFNLANSYARVLQFTSDPSVNIRIVSIIILGVVLFTAAHGLYTITKTSVLYYLFTFWIVFFELLQFDDIELQRYTPFFLKDGHWSLSGTIDVFGAFLAYETIMFMTPYLEKNMKWISYAAISSFVIGTYYTMYCFLSQGLLPIEQIEDVRFVVLRLYGATRINALEYITDLLFITFIFSAILTSSVYTWSALEGFKTLQKKDRHKENLFIAGVIMLALCYVPLNFDESKKLFSISNTILICIIILFTLLYFILPYKNKKANNNTANCENTTEQAAPTAPSSSSSSEGVTQL
ncbi:GerAB/ArcD/ProY family transporter [Paenibacillus sp. SC116]|uniref:GerAB/ArcD/ProY family transporter n=1 Tax=Paenibacillus sp. SC116 TaxID=2968986 RepID=UPI00215A3A6B|nr:GerAB/ArcD/ProY family transporter [Paenibacillus sp. SC116]MCR8843470.1 GerAB/ArcD/ProY family transporter [Paenibacillus sp. SC116]